MDGDLMTKRGRKAIENCGGGGCLRWKGNLFSVTPCGYSTTGSYPRRKHSVAHISVRGLGISLVDREIGKMYDQLEVIHGKFQSMTDEIRGQIDLIVFRHVFRVFKLEFLYALEKAITEKGHREGVWDAQAKIQEALGL